MSDNTNQYKELDFEWTKLFSFLKTKRIQGSLTAQVQNQLFGKTTPGLLSETQREARVDLSLLKMIIMNGFSILYDELIPSVYLGENQDPFSNLTFTELIFAFSN